MKGVMKVAALVLLTPVAALAQARVVGSWAGELSVQGTRLPLVFHIAETDGALRATMDSPLQGARGIPVDSVRWADGELTLKLVALNGLYAGRLEGDTLVGEWRQAGMALPLTLRRTEPGAAEPRRPQHPERPFPYDEQEVRFRNDAAGIALTGTLTLPRGTGPFPAVALVSGSGPQDRDETLLGHKPFLVLADHLTRAGIAVLRYDDRGVGASEGDFGTATSIDFAGDAAAAVAFLKQHSAIDAARVGIIGHSEGGLIAPLVATGAHGAPRADVAFIVLLAGPALPGDSILRLQGAAIAEAMGATPEQRRQASDLQARMLAILHAEPELERRRERLRAELTAILEPLSPAERAQQGIPAGREQQWIEAQVASVSTEWFRTFIRLDPRPVLRELRVPVLALFGALDLQVPPRENESAMRAALEAAPVTDFQVLTLPGLNHLFQHATTGAPAEYGAIEETMAPAALDAISRWILERR